MPSWLQFCREPVSCHLTPQPVYLEAPLMCMLYSILVFLSASDIFIPCSGTWGVPDLSSGKCSWSLWHFSFPHSPLNSSWDSLKSDSSHPHCVALLTLNVPEVFLQTPARHTPSHFLDSHLSEILFHESTCLMPTLALEEIRFLLVWCVKISQHWSICFRVPKMLLIFLWLVSAILICLLGNHTFLVLLLSYYCLQNRVEANIVFHHKSLLSLTP